MKTLSICSLVPLFIASISSATLGQEMIQVKNNNSTIKINNIKFCTGFYYKADKKGNLTGKKYKSSMEEYDSKGNITKETSYSSSGKIVETTVNEYDSKNIIIKASRYNSKGELKEFHSYKNDEKSRHLDGLRATPTDTIHFCYYFYDTNDSSAHLKEVHTINNLVFKETDPLEIVLQYKYDDTGRISETFEYEVEGAGVLSDYLIYKLLKFESYTYDSTGNMVETLSSGIKEYLGGTRYKYDNKGNIVELISINSYDIPEYLIYYEYEYYK